MKLVFQGDSLKEINQQILAAADELTREDVKADNVFTPPASDKTTGVNVSPIVNAFEGVDWAKLGTDKTVEQEPFAQPQSDGHVPAGTQSKRIDGYNVSDGKVWVPVEGRPSAYTGVPIDEYLKQREAKESGGELDAAGTPYNPAIHTSTRTKTTKGLWKNRPGGAAKAGVIPLEEVEHMGREKEESHIVYTKPEVNKPASVQQVVAHEDSAPAIGRAPSMHNYESFKTNLMTIVVKLINENKITRDYMKELNTFFGVSNLWDVKNDDVKCKQLFKLFLEYQFIMGA